MSPFTVHPQAWPGDFGAVAVFRDIVLLRVMEVNVVRQASGVGRILLAVHLLVRQAHGLSAWLAWQSAVIKCRDGDK